MREFSIDSKPSQQDLKYSDMEVASGHCNQIFSKLDRLCVDLEHNGLFSEVILVLWGLAKLPLLIGATILHSLDPSDHGFLTVSWKFNHVSSI